jgi:glutathione S-transferase
VKPILYLGNKNYSSWSMRPFLALRWGGIAFEHEVCGLTLEGWGQGRAANILAISPSGRVPALHTDGIVINDSLAICEWAAEQNPALWPADPKVRARARSAAAEMHSGFANLRRELPMNMKRVMSAPPALNEDVQRELARIFALWSDLRQSFGAGGPFLFGARTIADAFYAPIASRLRTYVIARAPVAAAYCNTIFEDAAFREWEDAALKETWINPNYDGMYA